MAGSVSELRFEDRFELVATAALQKNSALETDQALADRRKAVDDLDLRGVVAVLEEAFAQRFSLAAEGEKVVTRTQVHRAAELAVILRRIRAELFHAADHVESRHFCANRAAERVDRIAHRSRVRVVEIAIDRRLAAPTTLAAPLRGLPAFKTRLQIRVAHAELGSQRERQGGVLCHARGNAARDEGAFAVEPDLAALGPVEDVELHRAA